MPHLDRRTLLRVGAAGAGGLIATSALDAPAEAAPTARQILASGLEIPWGLTFLPNGNALVAERDSALIHRVSRHGGRRTVGRVSNVVPAGEGGLLGLALHPEFASNRWLYAYVTSGSDNRVVRMRYAGGGLSDQRLVIAGIPKGTIHNGGRLRFGPTGHLFVSTGDTGVTDHAQDPGSLGGKTLRVTDTGEVPGDNPFGRSPVWTLGHRNVQGLAFDGRGRLWATELGQNTRDELNQIVAGHNYGWPRVEGGDGPGGDFHDPVATWRPTSTCSPSGLAVLGRHGWVGALAGQSLYRVTLHGARRGRIKRFFHDTFGRIRTAEPSPDGSLWITTSNGSNDRVIRVKIA
jgi:glucose/arabinose dehydrogenase